MQINLHTNSHEWVCRGVTGVTEVTCTVNRVTRCESEK